MKSTYSKDFRGEALVLAQELGVAKAAERLGMSQNTLLKWWQKAKKQLNVEQSGTENEYDKLAKEALGIAQSKRDTQGGFS